MTAAEAYAGFWAQFGIPCFEEGAFPDADPPGYPCLSYRYGEGTGDGDGVALSASLFVRSPGWKEARDLAARIGEALPPGGIYLPVDEGGLWIRRDTPFVSWLGDGEDPFLRRILFRVTARMYGR